MVAVLSKGRQTLSTIMMVQITSSAKKSLQNTRLLSSFGFNKAADPLREQVFCRGLDSRLGKYMQGSAQRNLEILGVKTSSYIYIIYIYIYIYLFKTRI